MPAFRTWYRASLVGLCLLAAACSALVPPESCGPGTDAEPDEASFAQAFQSMELVTAETGEAGEPDEDGNPVFIAGDELHIRTVNLRPLNIRACVQTQRASGRIASEREGALPAGQAIIPLGSFEKGEYIARIQVDRVLVRNILFSVVEAED